MNENLENIIGIIGLIGPPLWFAFSCYIRKRNFFIALFFSSIFIASIWFSFFGFVEVFDGVIIEYLKVENISFWISIPIIIAFVLLSITPLTLAVSIIGFPLFHYRETGKIVLLSDKKKKYFVKFFEISKLDKGLFRIWIVGTVFFELMVISDFLDGNPKTLHLFYLGVLAPTLILAGWLFSKKIFLWIRKGFQ